jgi:hypothetical protein
VVHKLLCALHLDVVDMVDEAGLSIPAAVAGPRAISSRGASETPGRTPAVPVRKSTVRAGVPPITNSLPPSAELRTSTPLFWKRSRTTSKSASIEGGTARRQ